jgi:flagellar hook protein FlgE
MLRSLYSGVSGLKNHQYRMDIIGNNIANVNTVAFKSSRVVFEDIYSQTLQPASAPTTTTGGSNAQQVGLGVGMSAVDMLFTRTGSSYTGNALDVSIEGDGFFAVRDSTSTTEEGSLFTRAGNLKRDNNGNLVTSDGDFVMCWRDTDNDATTPDVQAILNIPDTYTDVSIDKNGVISGVDENDTKQTIGTLVLATFSNQQGLEKIGGSLYQRTANSGDPTYVVPGESGAATINPGALEMSNVDLAQEFTDMIITQRGFQANSRIITTSDQLLEELVNLKRS